MATFLELHSLFGNADLRRKVRAAVVIAAHDILQETTGPNLEARHDWADGSLNQPEQMADRVFMYLLGANDDQTVANIEGAADATILTQVNGYVNARIGAAS